MTPGRLRDALTSVIARSLSERNDELSEHLTSRLAPCSPTIRICAPRSQLRPAGPGDGPDGFRSANDQTRRAGGTHLCIAAGLGR